MHNQGSGLGRIGSYMVYGIFVIVILIPWGVKGLSRGHVNLNGLALDFAEAIGEAVTQRDLNFGDPAREEYRAPGG